MSKSANNKGRQYTKGKGSRKKKEDEKRGNAKAKRQRKKASGGAGSRGGAGQRSNHRYDTKEKIDELKQDRDEFVQRKFENKEKISVPKFLVGKPHNANYFEKFVRRDASTRAALPTLRNDTIGVSKGQTRAISAEEERVFIEDIKDVDITLTKLKKSLKEGESFADANPLMFAFENAFPHVTGEPKSSKVSTIRKKIGKLQEKERAIKAAAAAIAPTVSNDEVDDEEFD